MREILLVCIASGVCALDTTAAWQVMLSQPLVAGSLAGLVTGSPVTAVTMGILLQLLWSGSIPVGARPMPDTPVASVSGVWFASALLKGDAGLPCSSALLAGVLAALLVGLVGRETILLERELNRKFFERFLRGLRAGRNVSPGRVQVLSACLAFSRGFALCLASVAVLSLLVGPIRGMARANAPGYGYILALLAGLGAGVLFNTFVRKTWSRLVAFGGGVLFVLLLKSFPG